MDLEQLLKAGEEFLKNAGIIEGKTDAWYLMEYTFHLNRASFWLNCKRTVSEEDERQYMEYIQKRASHVPLQYITGEQEFMGLVFQVSRDVLIPRQDTEVLAEEVLKHCRNKDVLDMCTGSGCIIISLCKLGYLKSAAGCDISEAALLTARINARKNQVNVTWVQGDLFENIDRKYDIIVSNPPYIESREMETLMPEVRDHEPALALDGSEDGLYFYREIISKGAGYLNPSGRIFFETGYNQGEAVSRLLLEHGFTQVQVIKDLSGLDRVVSGVYKG